MKLKILPLVVLLAAFSPLAISAQIVEPTPTPDPHVYDDAGMHYVAPPDSVLLSQQIQHPGLSDLSQDPAVIVAWGLGKSQDDAKIISIAMETYGGSLEGFESQFENQLRGADDTVLVKSRKPAQLQNGMPAYFVEVTQGSGFDTRKQFAYVWIDGARGVVLSVSAPLGAIDDVQAKQLLAGATAVRYPPDAP